MILAAHVADSPLFFLRIVLKTIDIYLSHFLCQQQITSTIALTKLLGRSHYNNPIYGLKAVMTG
jgi:hypothetical protein